MTKEVTTKSWFERIVSAFFFTLFGCILLILAFSLIFKNENNHLKTTLSLRQTERVLISIPTHPIDNKNNLHAVYLTGNADTNAILIDKLFNVSEKAIKLHRHVEMYQWQEKIDTKTEKSLSGKETTTKTYIYQKVWSDQPIDSSKFNESTTHQNPTSIPIKSQIQYATRVWIGDFTLPKFMIDKINDPISINPNVASLKKLKAKYKKPVQENGESLYFGKSSANPEIGDFTVTVSKITRGPISIIAAQHGDTLEPYASPKGEKISLISIGQVSKEAMIRDAEDENSVITWILRFVTLFMMILSFYLIFGSLFNVLADVIPFFRRLVNIGTSLIAFVIGILLWTLITCIAWLSVRPLLSFSFIAFFVLIYILVVYSRRLFMRMTS